MTSHLIKGVLRVESQCQKVNDSAARWYNKQLKTLSVKFSLLITSPKTLSELAYTFVVLFCGQVSKNLLYRNTLF